MIINQDNCLFLIIDIQEKLLNAVFNKESLEKKASILSKAANLLNIPLLVTEQYPKGLGETIENLKYNAQIFVKDDFNALNNDDLLKLGLGLGFGLGLKLRLVLVLGLS